MPANIADSTTLETKTCPLCDTPLDPQHPGECSRCDWTATAERPHSHRIGTDRDMAAVLLSVVPGLGHIYKGHPAEGALFMAGGVLAVFTVGLIATFTMGFGVLLMPLYWIGLMMHVYWLSDRRAPAVAMR